MSSKSPFIVDSSNLPAEESDELIIRPLGSGQEVGRSCHMLEFKGKKIMLDCGIHPGMSGIEALPYTDIIDPSQIDLLLISHFHLDHCGGLPWFLEKTTFQGRCFMTHATKAIYRWLLSDYVKVSNIATEQMLYTEGDIEKSMDKIETIHFHQEVTVNGIKFWCYNAGHVLGAAMFMIEIAGVKILYTGDFSRQEDRHLMAAEIPTVKPDVLIVEATYGTHVHEPREERESRFTGLIHNIVKREGRCLIPVFALGRAQELLLILDEYWSEHPELHDIPIFYASSLAKKCMSVYQTYISAMNERIRRQIAIKNPFVFKHINYLKSIDHFEDVGPSVVMASPGMMQSGLSRELFESWCTDKRNGVIIAGYCVEGTLAKQILTEPEEIVTMSGQKLPRKCSVDYISFSAHTDYKQTSEFIRTLKPPHIVLVHGERNEMNRLKQALTREYEDDTQHRIHIYNPKNTQAVELSFRGEKMAKVIGKLAADRQEKKRNISGLLVKRNFNYHLMSAADLSSYTDLTTCSVYNKQSLPYSGNNESLLLQLNCLAGEVKQKTLSTGGNCYTIFDCVNVWLEQGHESVILEWKAGPVPDMFADSIISALTKNTPIETLPVCGEIQKENLNEYIIETLNEMFGEQATQTTPEKGVFKISVNGNTAVVNLTNKKVDCASDKELEQQLRNVVENMTTAILPVKFGV